MRKSCTKKEKERMAEAEGKRLMEEANAKMNSKPGLFGSLFGGDDKFQVASDKYEQAANKFKAAKLWSEAAKAYRAGADASKQAGQQYDAASKLVNAYNSYKKAGDKREAVQCLKSAIECYTAEGRFAMAAKYQKEIAEMHEADMDLDAAIEAYSNAADFYEGEGSNTTANQCWLKVAHFKAQLEKYDEAVQIFENVGNACLGNRLLEPSAGDYYLKAVLCRLAGGDAIGARKSLERYVESLNSFQERNRSFLEAIINAVDTTDVEGYTNAVADYDSISRLDNWKTTILLRIKNSMKAQEESLV